MSKAFTKEDDGLAAHSDLPPRLGLRSFESHLTKEGHARFAQEFDQLVQQRRDLAASGLKPEESQTRRLDQRLAELRHLLAHAEVKTVAMNLRDSIRFGATVTVRLQDSSEDTWRLVGPEEAGLDAGWISWQSPLARALLGQKAGARVHFRTPAGDAELTVLRIIYES